MGINVLQAGITCIDEASQVGRVVHDYPKQTSPKSPTETETRQFVFSDLQSEGGKFAEVSLAAHRIHRQHPHGHTDIVRGIELSTVSGSNNYEAASITTKISLE